MEAVKLESLQGRGTPRITNLEIAQETLGSVVVVSCGSQQLLVSWGWNFLIKIFSLNCFQTHSNLFVATC